MGGEKIPLGTLGQQLERPPEHGRTLREALNREPEHLGRPHQLQHVGVHQHEASDGEPAGVHRTQRAHESRRNKCREDAGNGQSVRAVAAMERKPRLLAALERPARPAGDARDDVRRDLMRNALHQIPDGTYRAEDFLDDDGYSSQPVRLQVTIRIHRGRATVDFTGSSPQCRGGVNAVLAITISAVFYVFRCLLGEDVPACAGLMEPIEILAPEASVVNARPPAAVAAGNVETSQRIVDVLLRALAHALPHRIPAASSGTMNNLSFGGIDPRTGAPFAYYETIAGGMGARCRANGLSGVHTHMTNSLNTPVEALESHFPVRVRRTSLRRGSGGRGRFQGGDGIIREIEFLTEVRCSVLSDRRRFPPYGLEGGRPGKTGRNTLVTKGRSRKLPSKTVFVAPSGSILRVETPGGGGWGKSQQPKIVRPTSNIVKET